VAHKSGTYAIIYLSYQRLRRSIIISEPISLDYHVKCDHWSL